MQQTQEETLRSILAELEKIYAALTMGHPPRPKYNTNFLFGGGLDASENRNILQSLAGPQNHDQAEDILAILAGTGYANSSFPAVPQVPPKRALYDVNTYNANSIIQNAFLGFSGVGSTTLMRPAQYANGVLAAANTASFSLGAMLPNPEGDILIDVGSTANGAFNNGRAITAYPVFPKKTSALAGQVPGSLEADYIASFKLRCLNGFLPTDNLSPEGILNKYTLGCSSPPLTNAFTRADRSLESLLGPFQYLAPLDMAAPDAGGYYVRFKKPADTDLYRSIHAAAGFCQNLALKSYPEAHPIKKYPHGNLNWEDSFELAAEKTWRETIDGKAVSNCWNFFEARVQYPASSLAPPSFAKRHTQQVARCKNDFEKLHIIDKRAYDTCISSGRSALQARADMAYRLDKPEYIAYLNTLGAMTRQILFARALADQESFEQTLLIERRIMTKSMTIPDRPAIRDYFPPSDIITSRGATRP